MYHPLTFYFPLTFYLLTYVPAQHVVGSTYVDEASERDSM
jgi:hypothetical protein